MSDPLYFQIPLPAEGKGRARSGVTFDGKKNHHTPKKTKAFELAVSQYAHIAMRGRSLILGRVRLTMKCEHRPPQSWSDRLKTLSMGNGKATKPDADNVMKSVCDALNKIVWRDDAQVVEWIGSKVYGPKDLITVLIEELE